MPDFPYFCTVKCIFSIGFLILFSVAACTRGKDSFLSPADEQDAEYTLLMDSVENVLDGNKYNDFTDSLVRSASAFYTQGHTPRHYWMQVRCHYLTGCLILDNNHFSEEATAHFMEALDILDSHFDAREVSVGRLYSKIYYILSHLAYNFSDKQCSTQYARWGLDCASAVSDTSWMIRSCANLGKLYERFGKAGEGDTAYFYCWEGLKLADSVRYPYETALLFNTLANCHRHSHEYDSAFYRFGQSELLLDSSCYLYHKNALERAFVHYRSQDYLSALADLEVAYQSKDESIKMQSAYCFADCYEKMGDTLKAMPYYAFVKVQDEKLTVEMNHNAKVLSMLNAYLKGKESQQSKRWSLWLLLPFVVSVVVVILMRRRDKQQMAVQHAEAQKALEEKDRHQIEAIKKQQDKAIQQARTLLPQRVNDLYHSKVSNRMERIMAEFEAAYPLAMEQLTAAYPNLNEIERQIAVLNFLRFRSKEEADLTGFTENTTLKYRSNLKKKAGSDPISALISEGKI